MSVAQPATTIRSDRRSSLLVFLAWGLGAVLAALGLLRLEVDTAPERLFRPSAAARASGTALRSWYAAPASRLVAVVDAPDVTERALLDYQRALMDALDADPHVTEVHGLANLPRAAFGVQAEAQLELDDLEAELETERDADTPETLPQAVLQALSELVSALPEHFPAGLASVDAERLRALREPFAETSELTDALRRSDLPARLLAQDRTATSLCVSFAELPDEPAARVALVKALNARIAAVPAPDGVTVALTGLLPIRSEVFEGMRRDQMRLLPGALVLTTLILWWLVGSLGSAIAALICVGLAAFLTFGILGWLGWPLTVLTSILPALLVVIGVSDCVHLVLAFRARGHGAAAAWGAARALLRPCALTSATTAAGFAALAFADNAVVSQLGVVGALGVSFALLAAMTLFPACLALGVDGQGRKRARHHQRALKRAVMRFTAQALRHPLRVWGLLALVFGVALPGVWQLRASTSPLDQISARSPAWSAGKLVDEKLGGLQSLRLVLESEPGTFFEAEPLGQVAELRASLANEPAVSFAAGPQQVLGALWQQLTEPGTPLTPKAVRHLADLARRTGVPLGLKPDGGAIVLELGVEGRAIRALPAVKARAEAQVAALGLGRIVWLGTASESFAVLDALLGDLGLSLGLALFVIAFLLRLAYGCWRLSLVALLTNLVPLYLAFAYMGYRGLPLNAAAALIFTLSFGLAVDASIHLLSRWCAARRKASRVAVAILRAHMHAGPAVISANLTLGLGFALMLLSEFPPVRNFGEVVGVTVVVCLLSTLALQPLLLRAMLRSGRKLP